MLTPEQRKHLEPIEAELRKRGAMDFPINTLEPQLLDAQEFGSYLNPPIPVQARHEHPVCPFCGQRHPQGRMTLVLIFDTDTRGF